MTRSEYRMRSARPGWARARTGHVHKARDTPRASFLPAGRVARSRYYIAECSYLCNVCLSYSMNPKPSVQVFGRKVVYISEVDDLLPSPCVLENGYSSGSLHSGEWHHKSQRTSPPPCRAVHSQIQGTAVV